MGRTIRCEHYVGMGAETCAAGVRYDDVTLGKGTPQFSMPCVVGARRDYNPLGAKCDKCKMPTPEELAAEEAESNKRMEETMRVRAAIVTHLGGPWKKGDRGRAGSIDCPVCVKGCVNFTRAGLNGHVHAHCSTEGCVSWME